MLKSMEQREVRQDEMRMRMRSRLLPEPDEQPAPAPAPPEPECVTPEELARRWHVSPTTIRRWFRDEPGVLQWGEAISRPGRKRAHLSMRIPLAVAERVWRRMASKGSSRPWASR